MKPSCLVLVALVMVMPSFHHMILAQDDLLLPIGSDCQDDSDCETSKCYSGFQAPGSPGICGCDTETNAGCDENAVCTLPEGLLDGFPSCLVPLGFSCITDSDCATDRCFYGEQPDGTPGICWCNSETNAGCEEGWFCSDAQLDMDGPPRCVLPVGAECSQDKDCEAYICFTNFLLPQGMCICELETNLGCAEGEQCLANKELADVPPMCVNPNDECTTNLDCETEVCFSGACQCNVVSGAGCNEEETCVGNDTNGYECQAKTGTPTQTPGDTDPVDPPTTTSAPPSSSPPEATTPVPTNIPDTNIPTPGPTPISTMDESTSDPTPGLTAAPSTNNSTSTPPTPAPSPGPTNSNSSSTTTPTLVPTVAPGNSTSTPNPTAAPSTSDSATTPATTLAPTSFSAASQRRVGIIVYRSLVVLLFMR